jgi:hypothetical protein
MRFTFTFGRGIGRCGLIGEPMALALAAATLALGISVAGCHSTTEVPEPGAALLRVALGEGASMPDELRVFVYDDTGPLWNGVRMPAEGPLVPESATLLGTILIQPGITVGDLRVDLHGLAAGLLVDEGTRSIAPAERPGGTFDVTLVAALPADGDGDGIPDPVDDCPSVADPSQRGCHPDGGVHDGASDAAVDGRSDAATRRSDASAAADAAGHDAHQADARQDASPEVPPGSKARGAACGGAIECSTGFCVDGVCCNNACTDACNSCTTGKCTAVKSADDAPQCVGPMTCNNKGNCVSRDGG